MTEYEYEVTFYGKQWVATVLCFNELDSEASEENQRLIIDWADSMAHECNLDIGEYHEVKVVKTGELK